MADEPQISVVQAGLYLVKNLNQLKHLTVTQWVTLASFGLATALGGAPAGAAFAASIPFLAGNATAVAIVGGIGGFLIGVVGHLSGLVTPTPIPEIHDMAVKTQDIGTAQKKIEAEGRDEIERIKVSPSSQTDAEAMADFIKDNK